MSPKEKSKKRIIIRYLKNVFSYGLDKLLSPVLQERFEHIHTNMLSILDDYEYAILYAVFVEKEHRTTITKKYNISEGTYYYIRSKAIEKIGLTVEEYWFSTEE